MTEVSVEDRLTELELKVDALKRALALAFIGAEPALHWLTKKFEDAEHGLS